MKIITNILKFENKPLKNKITIFEYKQKTKLDFRRLGDILLNLKKVPNNRKKVIIQFNDIIISTEKLEDNFEKDLERKLQPPESRLISVTNKKEIDIIKRIIGDAIAVNLHHSNKLWKIQETYNSIFEVSSPEIIDGFGKINVFPGFQYSPIILENGEVGVMVDLKYKFHSSESLRDKYARTSITINQNRYYVDTCPISQCPEKKDPFSNCRYAGTGRSIKLKSLIDKKPSEIKIEEINLKQFHELRHICPRTPVLADFLKDEPPVVLSIYHDENNKYYSYPLERIREQPTFVQLSYHDRGALMKQIRPNPPKRYQRSYNYMRYIGQLSIGSIVLNPDRKNYSWNSYNSGIFESNNYVIGNSYKSEYPTIDIENYGLYDTVPSKLKIYFVVFRDYNQLEKELLKKPFLETKKEIIVLKQFIDSEIVISKMYKIIDEVSLNDFIAKCNEENSCIIIVHSSNDIPNHEFKDLVQIKLIKNELSHQGINYDNYKKKFEAKQNGYFKNIYLGIIAKIGLMAWLLNVNEDKLVKFIGLQSQNISHETSQYRALLTSYYDSGKFTGGYYISTKTEYRQQNLELAFQELFDKTKEIILIKNGKILDKELLDIENSLRKLNLKYSIIEIISSSPLRIYSKNDNNRIFRPNNGAFYWLSRTEVGLVSTQGNAGTQNPIIIRNVKCDEDKFEKSIKKIYQLCQCYTGWDRIETKLPVPIHTASRGMSKIPKDMKSFSFKRSWFI